MLNIQRYELLTDLAILLQSPNTRNLEKFFKTHKNDMTESFVDYLFLELCEKFQNDKNYEKSLRFMILLDNKQKTKG